MRVEMGDMGIEDQTSLEMESPYRSPLGSHHSSRHPLDIGDDSRRKPLVSTSEDSFEQVDISPSPSIPPPFNRTLSDHTGQDDESSRPTSMTTHQNDPASMEELRPIDEARQIAAEFAQMPRTGPLRLRDVMHKFGGRNRFRLGGRCVTGPEIVDSKFNAFTWCAITLPSAFYFSVCGPFLWSTDSWMPIVTLILLIFCITFLILTSCTDPGIIPRYALRLCVDGLAEKTAIATGCRDVNIDIVNGTRDEQIMTSLECRGYRWCSFCKMIQPPRAKHCRDCDCCVLRNDHHCPFVNNCVGQRNYRYFYGFILSLLCLGISVFAGIGLWWFSESGRENVVVLCVVVVPTSFFLLGVVGLSLWHTVLICRGKTTREVLTGRTYGEGSTLWAERGPALIDGRKLVRFPGGSHT